MLLFAVTIPESLYQIYGYAVPILILAVLFAFRWKVGMWGNCLTLGAVLFSALIAIGLWKDVAGLLAEHVPDVHFVAETIAVCVLFLISLAILDTATRFLSTVKVKYNDTIEKVGNGVVLLLLSLVLWQFHNYANVAL